MKLSKSNWYIKVYYYFTNEYPKDVCTLFWTSLLILLSLPIIIPGKLFEGKYGNVWDNIWSGIKVWGVYILLWVLGGSVWWDGANHVFSANHVFKYDWGHWSWIVFPLTIPIIIIITAIPFVLIGLGYYYLIEKYKKYREVKGFNEQHTDESKKPKESVWDKVKMFWGAIRGKYCTKIEWKE